MNDGRHITPGLGVLAGEGAQQRIETTVEGFPSRSFVWRDLPSHAPAPAGRTVSLPGTHRSARRRLP